jgi:WD40 repeat protein
VQVKYFFTLIVEKIFSKNPFVTVRVRNVGFKVFHGHTDRVRAICFSPDSKFIVSAGSDKVIRLWNFFNEECLTIFRGHRDTIYSLAFSTDGKIIVSCSRDETIKFWDAASGQCLNTLKERSYENMNITGVKGLTDAEIATLKALGAVEDGEM